MEKITYERLSADNFDEFSLDDFIRHQEIKECWRKINGEYVLVPNEFTEDWDTAQCRNIALTVKNGIACGGIAYGAFHDGRIIGYIFISGELFGSEKQYIELKLFHVSQPFRRMGAGKELFRLACEEAKGTGAKKLYISAHSSKESQAAYRKLGCVDAAEINTKIAEDEPFDIQMEYLL